MSKNDGKIVKSMAGKIGRREFVKKSALIGASSAAAFTLAGRIAPVEALAVETPELDRMKVKCLKVGFTNCFIIPCDGGYMQIDVGYPNHYKKYLKGLDKLGIDISEIKYLLLTHHHDDHVGFAAELVENCGAKIIVHEKALEPLARGVSEEDIHPINGCVKLIFLIFSSFHKFVFPPVVTSPEDFIVVGDDGELLRKIGVDADILYTPGHTDDSISVVMKNDSGDEIAFAGDVAMDLFNFCCCKHRPIFVKDIEEVYRSWDRFRERDVKTIYPAHGDPFPTEKLVRV